MKKHFRLWLTACAASLSAVPAAFLAGCNDDLAADSYYTFTGEMMSDFLTNRDEFSLFRRIAERAGEMDLLASRGGRTLFPAVNSGVEDFLKEYGYASVEDIPADFCDTLLKASLIDNAIIYTFDLSEATQAKNELDLPLVIETTGDTVDADGMVLSVINRRAAIINGMKNDSVENGVVHPVDKVLVPSTGLGSTLLDENHGEFTIYYEALLRTHLMDSLVKYQDDDYEITKENYQAFIKDIKPGTYTYTIKRPDHRYSKFTLFLVPDRDLYERYPDRFNEGMTMDEKIKALYDLAAEKYGDEDSEKIFGLDKVDPNDPEGRTYKELHWNEGDLTDSHNPLNIFMAYHIVDRFFASTDKFINCWGFDMSKANPTEWISTLLPFSAMKLEKVYSRRDVVEEYSGDFFINHNDANKYNSYQKVRGSHVTVPSGENGNFALNVAYYYVDDVLAYDLTTRNNVFNTRVRMDVVTLWPELTNNDMRLNGDPTEVYSASADNSENGGKLDGFNYYLPPGYLKGAKYNENTIFMVHRPKLNWWDFGGDEITFLGVGYDVEFNLPNVPPGTYEFRLSYNVVGNRGIAQIYLNDVPQGIPIDMTFANGAEDSRVGGLYNGAQGWRNIDENPSEGKYTTEQLEENARIMKNNGYYSPGKSLVHYNSGQFPDHMGDYEPSKWGYMYNVRAILVRKICDVVVRPNEVNKVRFRSVLSEPNMALMMDYIELVPLTICGAGGLGEDPN